MVSLKILRKIRMALVAKNLPKRGKSARNGNAPSPYTKHQKTPYRYSARYYEWRADRLAGRTKTKASDWHAEDRNEIRQFKMAAE